MLTSELTISVIQAVVQENLRARCAYPGWWRCFRKEMETGQMGCSYPAEAGLGELRVGDSAPVAVLGLPSEGRVSEGAVGDTVM